MSEQMIRNGVLVPADAWTLVSYPASDEPVQKQAGKLVTAKLTGAPAASAEVVAALVVPAGLAIVPLAVWLARQDELAPRLAAGELGVWIDACELVEDLVASVADINAFPLIAVNFPKFVDGRGYSTATLLRTRYGYRNELRAVGEVLRDFFFFMKRSGFDVLVPSPARYTPDQLQAALASLQDFSEPYQGAVDQSQPLWRRYARGVNV